MKYFDESIVDQILDNLPTNEEINKMLTKYSKDEVVEVRETCQLALDMMEFRKNNKNVEGNEYGSVDPAPASKELNVDKLKTELLNTNLSLFERYFMICMILHQSLLTS